MFHLLLLVTLVGCSTSIVQLASEINFMNTRVTTKEWLELKYNINCWTRSGNWEFNSNVGHKYDQNINYMQNFNKASPCQPFNEGTICNQGLEGNSSHYVWKPAHRCKHDLRQFHSSEYCNGKISGNVLIVGDSMNELLARVWANEVSVQNNSPRSCSSLKTMRNFSLECSRGLTTIYSVRNDRLSLTDKTIVNKEQDVYEMEWVSLLTKLNISLVLLNRGAHYVSDVSLHTEAFATFDYLRKNHPNIGVIWRNTPYGHHKYAKQFLDEPLREPQQEDLEGSPRNYHYSDFKSQNALIRQMIQYSFPEVIYLDVSTATVLRRDSHQDALHYCVIGPVLHWVHLIYSIMYLVSTKHS